MFRIRPAFMAVLVSTDPRYKADFLNRLLIGAARLWPLLLFYMSMDK